MRERKRCVEMGLSGSTELKEGDDKEGPSLLSLQVTYEDELSLNIFLLLVMGVGYQGSASH